MNLMHSESLNKKKLLRDKTAFLKCQSKQVAHMVYGVVTLTLEALSHPPHPNNYDGRAGLFHMPDKEEF